MLSGYNKMILNINVTLYYLTKLYIARNGTQWSVLIISYVLYVVEGLGLPVLWSMMQYIGSILSANLRAGVIDIHVDRFPNEDASVTKVPTVMAWHATQKMLLMFR